MPGGSWRSRESARRCRPKKGRRRRGVAKSSTREGNRLGEWGRSMGWVRRDGGKREGPPDRLNQRGEIGAI